jgi:general secretion pathway protein M
MRPLSQRERRLFAILILIAVISLALLVVVGPIIGGFNSRAQQRAQLAQQFLINEQRIASLGALQREALRQEDTMRTTFLTAPDADEAGETLREQVEATAQGTGATIKATEATASADDGWVRVTLEAKTTHAQFATLLARLNQQQPAVVVETFVANAADALNDPKSDSIDVRLEISAPFIRAR